MANGKLPNFVQAADSENLAAVERAIAAVAPVDHVVARVGAIAAVLRDLSASVENVGKQESSRIDQFADELETEFRSFVDDLIARRRRQLAELERIIGAGSERQ